MTKKYVPSQEMLDDYSKMGDKDLGKKYGVSLRIIIKLRKELGLPSFNLQHNLRPHKFEDGKEYKWCGSGHWDLVENFGVHSSRYDGLRGHCKLHSNQSTRISKNKIAKTPIGKFRIRERNCRRKNTFILWEHEDELRAFEVYENRCAYCGTPITFETVEFDHFVPVKLGGRTLPVNIIPSCVECNRGVGGKKAREAFEWLCSKFGESRAKLIYADIRKRQRIIGQETKDRVISAFRELLLSS